MDRNRFYMKKLAVNRYFIAEIADIIKDYLYYDYATTLQRIQKRRTLEWLDKCSRFDNKWSNYKEWTFTIPRFYVFLPKSMWAIHCAKCGNYLDCRTIFLISEKLCCACPEEEEQEEQEEEEEEEDEYGEDEITMYWLCMSNSYKNRLS